MRFRPHTYLAQWVQRCVVILTLVSGTAMATTSPGRQSDVSIVAGTGAPGYNGDGIPAVSAQLNYPSSVFVDREGNLYIADTFNHRVRRVDYQTGIISTVAGTGKAGFNGDGILASTAQLSTPTGVFVDGNGNLFIADRTNRRIRMVNNRSGLISTVAGTGIAGYNGDDIIAISALLAAPWSVYVDNNGNLIILDTGNYRVRRVDGVTGIITTITATGMFDFDSIGYPTANEELNFTHSASIDNIGNIYVADYLQNLIKKLTGASGGISEARGFTVPPDKW